MEIKDLSILAVDDEEPIRQIIFDFFTMFGAKNIFTASGAAEAIDIIKKEKIDLIISDQNMPPGPSGIELLREVKQYHKHIVFILMSAFNIKKEAEIAGADAFRQKPISLMELKEVIEGLQ